MKIFHLSLPDIRSKEEKEGCTTPSFSSLEQHLMTRDEYLMAPFFLVISPSVAERFDLAEEARKKLSQNNNLFLDPS